MADTKISAKLELEFQEATEKMANLKYELEGATGALKKAEKEFGFWSNEAVEAAGKVGEIRDAIEKTDEVLKKFAISGEEIFKSFTEAGKGLIGGFGALTGIMGSFGEKSEAIESALEKVRAVMELSEQLEGIKKVGDAFKNFGGVLSEVAKKGFGSIKAAIAETGIGLLVIGITILISKFIDWVSGAEDAKEAQDKLKTSTDNLNNSLRETQAQLTNQSNLAVSRAKAIGASEKEIFETQQFYAKQNQILLKDAVEKKKQQLKEFEAQRLTDEESEKVHNDIKKDLATTEAELVKSTADIEIAQNERQAKELADTRAKRLKNDADWQQHQKDEFNQAKQAAADQLQSDQDKIKNKENFDIALAKQQKKSDEEIFKIQHDAREENIKKLQDYVNKLTAIKGIEKGVLAKANQALADAQNQANVADIDAQTTLNEKKAEIQKEADDELKKIIEQNNADKAKAANKYGVELINHEFEIQQIRINNLAISEEQKRNLIKQYETKRDFDLKKARKQEQDDIDVETKKQEVAIAEIEDMQKGTYQQQADKLKKWYDDKTTIIGKNEEKQKQLQKLYAKQKLELELNLASDLLGQAANLFGKQTVAGKTFAVAQATIDTYKAANSAYASMAGIPVIGPALGAVAAGLAIASGVKNIKSIVSTKVDGASDNTSAPGIDSSAIAPNAPLTPSVQQTNTTLNQDQLNQIGNATVRAFVVESDVSNNQEKIARLNRAARLGG
jgi:hypothetical protein